MKFTALFIFMLDCVRGKITKAMIDEVNEDVLKGDGLMSSAFDPYLSYIYFDSILFQLGKSYFDKTPLLKNFINRYFGEDKPENILSATLNTFFSLSRGGTIKRDVINSSITERYFSDNESRFDNIKMFSTFFLKLLQKDKSIKLTRKYDEDSITDPELSDILNKNIEKDQMTLVFSLVTLNAFMLEVLDTTEELKEYLTNILDHLTNEDKEYIKTSPHYYLKFNKVESNINEIMILNTLYNIPYPNFVFNFYKLMEYVIPIPTENGIEDFIENLPYFDFVEFMLLHLCNFLFYDEEKEQFDLKHLKLDADSNLLNFYTKYKRPFDIFDKDIREDWSKIVKNLRNVEINVKSVNDNFGRIYYKNEFTENEFVSSISNVVAVLTNICSSENNDIKNKYIELFNRELEVDSVDDLLQSFFKLLVKNSADLKCLSMGTEIKEDNSIYSIIIFTAKTKYKEKEFIKQLNFASTTYLTNFWYKFDKNFQFFNDLKKISFEFKDNEEFNALEFIIVSYVDELQKKLFNKLPETDNSKTLLLSSRFRH